MIRVNSVSRDNETTLRCTLVVDGQPMEFIVRFHNDDGIQMMTYDIADVQRRRDIKLRPESMQFMRLLWDVYNGTHVAFPVEIVSP